MDISAYEVAKERMQEHRKILSEIDQTARSLAFQEQTMRNLARGNSQDPQQVIWTKRRLAEITENLGVLKKKEEEAFNHLEKAVRLLENSTMLEEWVNIVGY